MAKRNLITISKVALATLFLGVLGATSAEANTIYTVNETITGPLNGIVGNPSQTDSVVGSITTDGTIGVLHASNILGWNLDLIDVTNPQYNYDLVTNNSLIAVDEGSVLSASATGLFFNFSATGAFGFQADNPGQYSGFHYWCLSENWYGCLNGNSIAPDNVYAGEVGDDLVVAGTGSQGQVGNSPLNQGGTSTNVPEPITLSLFGAGLAGAVAMRRRKKAA
jgi:hypothetical protein